MVVTSYLDDVWNEVEEIVEKELKAVRSQRDCTRPKSNTNCTEPTTEGCGCGWPSFEWPFGWTTTWTSDHSVDHKSSREAPFPYYNISNFTHCTGLKLRDMGQCGTSNIYLMGTDVNNICELSACRSSVAVAHKELLVHTSEKKNQMDIS
ncbi:unnamed protein product [Cylicocyclus nassatus]|uniref:Uncharacterized protein n=1 Tax=Cylicocyclus nassatus TaxID=53992 RepID=A0AA36M9K6_CYLNA|nr:unnamed protein product [Cylicocyclus nassatus]